MKKKRNPRDRSLENYLLVYDANCGPCSRFKRIIDWFDIYDHLKYLSLMDADERGFLDSIPKDRRHTSFHLIFRGGRIESGSNAIPYLAALLPLGREVSFLIRTAPLGRRMIDFVYSTLSRLHDTGSCTYRSGSSNFSPIDSRELTRKNRLGKYSPSSWLE